MPQIWLNYRNHSAAGLSSGFMMLWAWAGIPLGVYNIVSDFSIALQIQPQILTCLSLVTWAQCNYYERKWTLIKALTVVLPVACVMGGIEVALVYGICIAVERGLHWPLVLMAALAAALLAMGVLEQYWSIWKHKSVHGISFLFCGIDALGDVTSIVSVIFRPHLDVVGLVAYAVELVLWLGVFAAGGYFGVVPCIVQKSQNRRSNASYTGAEQGTEVVNDAVQLHEIPSTTSVFRTPSNEAALRSRRSLHAPSVLEQA